MPYTPDSYSNFGISSVAGGAAGLGTPLQPTDTTLYVPSADVAKLPASSTAQFRVQIGASDFAKVTSRSSNVLTIVRANNLASSDPDYNANTPPIAAVGTTVQEAVTAGSIYSLWTAINNGRMFIVTDYGALGNGSNDDTSAIQSAINACQNAGGGIVFLPAGTYKTSAALVIAGSNVELRGAGWETIIKPASGANYNAIQSTIPGSQGGGFQPLTGVVVSNLHLDCSQMTGTTAGAGNGMHFYGCQNSGPRNVRVNGCKNYACILEGDPNGGYNCFVENCLFDADCVGGILTWAGCEANWIRGNGISGCAGTLTAAQPAFGSRTTFARGLYIDTGVNFVEQNVFGNGGATTTEVVRLENTMSRLINNKWDGCLYQGLVVIGDHHMIIGNEFNDCSHTGSVEAVQLAHGHNLLIGNVFRPSGGGPSHYTYAVKEQGGPYAQNTLIGNHFEPGTSGTTNFHANSTPVLIGNSDANPAQSIITPPSAPSVANNGSGGTIAAGTYQVEVTLVTATGETAGSPAASTVTSGSTSTITIQSPVPYGNAVGWYAYVTQAGGAANTATRQQTVGNWSKIGDSYTLTAPPTNTGATVPASNTTAGVTTPAVPATTVALQNTTGRPVTVYLTGGTVTAVAIGNTTTGLTSGAFYLPAGQTITWTGSAAPTWVWVGE